MRAVLRRYAGPTPAPAASLIQVAAEERYGFDRWTLDVSKRELKDDTGAVQELTTAEFDMLKMFAERPSRVLSRDNIMDLLKGHEWSPFDRSIDALIVRVRRKIELASDAPRIIKTVRGVGYVMAIDVRKD